MYSPDPIVLHGPNVERRSYLENKKIRVGLIGANVHYGWGRRAPIPALLALPEYELAAVCTAHKDTAEESAKRYGVPLAFHDYHEMVTHPDIDLVFVSVRVQLHYPLVMAALEAGKHVFCEWPLGDNLAEAKQMAALAKSKGVQHMVGLQSRGDPGLLWLKELLTDGYVGDLLTCRMSMFIPGNFRTDTTRAWMADVKKGAGTLTLASGHAIDAFCFCVGEFTEVSSRVTTQGTQWDILDTGEKVDVTTPDNVLISGVLENGAVASVHVAAVPWHGTGWRIEVYGREGTLVAAGDRWAADIRLRGGRSKDGGLEELPIPGRLTWVPAEVPKGEPFNVAQLYRRLGEAIRNNESADPDFNLAVTRQRLIGAIQQSSDRREQVIV